MNFALSPRKKGIIEKSMVIGHPVNEIFFPPETDKLFLKRNLRMGILGTT